MSDIVYKIGVPILMFLISLIANSIKDRMQRIEDEVKTLRQDISVNFEQIRVESAIMKTRLEVLEKGG